jgi:hypothetical protein
MRNIALLDKLGLSWWRSGLTRNMRFMKASPTPWTAGLGKGKAEVCFFHWGPLWNWFLMLYFDRNTTTLVFYLLCREPATDAPRPARVVEIRRHLHFVVGEKHRLWPSPYHKKAWRRSFAWPHPRGGCRNTPGGLYC